MPNIIEDFHEIRKQIAKRQAESGNALRELRRRILSIITSRRQTEAQNAKQD
jgi:hypothetical protein